MLKQLRTKISMFIMLVGLVIMNPSCSTPHIPDPTVQYPSPPATLMEPSRNMQTIPTEK